MLDDGLGAVSGRWYACLRVNKSDVKLKRFLIWKDEIYKERGFIDFFLEINGA